MENKLVLDLIQELCNVMSKNDPAVSSNLFALSSRILSKSPSNSNMAQGIEAEPFEVNKIREHLSKQSAEKVEKFNLLYSKICESGVVSHRSSVLAFLLTMAKDSQNSEVSNRPSRTNFRVPEPCLLSSSSQGSIKRLFDSRDRNKLPCANLVPRAYSQTTTASSVSWSKNDIPTSSKITAYNSATERELLQDLIYSFQGIEGKFLRKEPGGLGFTLDPKAEKFVTSIQRGLVERIVGISFLHNRLKWYCQENEGQSGIICQALIATLNDDLSEYYKSVALLQDSLNKQTSISDLTLRRILCVMFDHHQKFEWLAYIAEQCSDKKGGALITAIHGFLQHGSKCAQEISERVLKAVCKPLCVMLSRWLLDGEINDPYGEFFIEAKSIIMVERLWHDKYHIRHSMVPSFIANSHALKILAIGKNINFLKQTYKDDGQLPGKLALQKLFRIMSAEALFVPEKSIEFHTALENIYKETSRRVLNLLIDGYKLYEHLDCLKRYMLLGQGDFSRYLLELLAPELNKPAEQIYNHTLTVILESAIRATNAQYEDEDTIQRLKMRFMSISTGDKGWDVFSLDYVVDGPIGIIFQQAMPTYQSLFGALWKVKRAEYIMANMKRQQLAMAKMFRMIKELKPVMHFIHCLTSRMVHFIQQTQYYFLEVLECSWVEMQACVKKAECLDDIIVAHNSFLSSLQRGVLLDEESKLFSHLISIYNFIQKLEVQQETLFRASVQEKETYIKYYSMEDKTLQDQESHRTRLSAFQEFLINMKVKIKCSIGMYDETVKKFLELLAKSGNNELHLLSIKLNFNNFVA